MPTIPNREDALARPRSRKGKKHAQPVTKAESKPIIEFEPNPDWHPSARMLWEAGLSSGGASFYENTDLAVLHFTCEAVSHWSEQGGRRSPELLRVVMQSLGSLLFTEADRRKVRIELEHPDESDQDWRENLVSLFSTETDGARDSI